MTNINYQYIENIQNFDKNNYIIETTKKNNENIYINPIYTETIPIEPIYNETNYININNPLMNPFMNPLMNPFNNPLMNPLMNQFNNPLMNENNFDNSYDTYKKKVNKEFKDYIINIFKDYINYIFQGQFMLKLKKICNIKQIFIKILNPKISLINNLFYKIHKKHIAILIDNFMLVMKNKGYHYFDFDNCEYILYELVNNNIDNNDYNYMYFIKIYNKKNNFNIDHYTKKSTWLFNKDTMYEYIY